MLDQFLIDLWNSQTFWHVMGIMGIIALILVMGFLFVANSDTKSSSSSNTNLETLLLVLFFLAILPAMVTTATISKQKEAGGAVRMLVTLGVIGLWCWLTLAVLGGVSGTVLCVVGIVATLIRTLFVD